MIGQLVFFLIGAILTGVIAVILDYRKQKKNDTVKKSIKEYIKDFEIRHSKSIKIFGVFVIVIFGLIVLINLGFYFKDFIASTVGGGFSIPNAKRIAGIVGVVIFVGVLVFNILKGTFSISKFFGGFNVFAGAVQGKLIFYAIIAAVAFGVYQKIIQPTVRTDYKNNIKAETVYIDQKPILPEIKYAFRLQSFGLDIHFFRITPYPKTNTVNNLKADTIVQNGV